MIQVSDLYKQASNYSHSMTSRVELHRPGYPMVILPVVAGTVTCDRTRKVRWAVDISLAYQYWEQLPENPTSGKLKVFRGISSLGSTEMVQLGEYRIDSWQPTQRRGGEVSVQGSSFESYVADARFLQPRTPPYGASTVATITSLISECVPGGVYVASLNRTDKRITATSPWDRERIDAVTALADSIDAEVYCDNTGQFMIKDKPALASTVPLATFKSGPGELLISRSQSESRDQVYNAVAVSNQSSNASTTPYFGFAFDNDPISPTYYFGPFGQKPRFYSSQFFTSNEQCARVAKEILADSLVPVEKFSFEVPAVIWLEAGDVVSVEKIDGSLGKYMISSTSVGLNVDGRLTADTHTARDLE